jgi:hypothetical protein
MRRRSSGNDPRGAFTRTWWLACGAALLVLVGAAASASTAAAAGVNTPVPDFHMFFNYNIVHGRVQLTGVIIKPFYRRFESLPTGGCNHCVGHAELKPAVIHNDTYSEQEGPGGRTMTSQTRFVEVITSPNRVVRFKVYGLDPKPPSPHPVLIKSGCTPANLHITNAEAFDYTKLWTVPCGAAPPGNYHLAISLPLELSSTVPTGGVISGVASHPMWLVAFQTKTVQACRVNALAEELKTETFFEHAVSGSFQVPFNAAPATAPGTICAFLQYGGVIKVTSGAVLPFGRVTATTQTAFLAGDNASIVAPTTAAQGQTIQVQVSGYVNIKEQLYLFAPDTPCAANAQSEYAVDPSDYTQSESPGGFLTHPINLTLNPHAPPTVYVCAYLTNGAPTASSVPSGEPIASAQTTLAVSPSS